MFCSGSTNDAVMLQISGGFCRVSAHKRHFLNPNPLELYLNSKNRTTLFQNHARPTAKKEPRFSNIPPHNMPGGGSAHGVHRYLSKSEISDHISPFLSTRAWPQPHCQRLAFPLVEAAAALPPSPVYMDLFSVYSKQDKRLFAFYAHNSATHVRTKAFSHTSETVLVAKPQTSPCFECTNL